MRCVAHRYEGIISHGRFFMQFFCEGNFVIKSDYKHAPINALNMGLGRVILDLNSGRN